MCPHARMEQRMQVYNLKVRTIEHHPDKFQEVFPDSRFLHYANRIPRVMANRITYDHANQRVVATSHGSRKDVLDLLWMDAWRETRRLLDMPMKD